MPDVVIQIIIRRIGPKDCNNSDPDQQESPEGFLMNEFVDIKTGTCMIVAIHDV